ncbi:MAG: hypothetical protein CMC55_08815 [Flavobacteriaceae bacterium]|nr:hypothetical protein [Flavobacteriaceae bacterium]
MVGQSKLHKKVAIAAAGNLITDNAVVTPISTALQSRVVHIMLEASLEDFKSWAFANNISANVIAFLNYKPQYLHSFNPEHDDHTFACPRTWEFASKLENQFSGALPKYNTILFQGVLGKGVGLEFSTFIEIQKELVTYEEVVQDPVRCKIPNDLSTQWMLLSHLVTKVTKADLKSVLSYVKRMPIEFTTMFIKDLAQKDKELVRTNPEINNWIMENSHRLV